MITKHDIELAVSGSVRNNASTLDAFSRDASIFRKVPEYVVAPRNASDIQALVRLVGTEKEKDTQSSLSLTARAAGTDMSGGPLSDSIVLDMLPYFRSLTWLSETTLRVEPGLYYRELDAATRAKNLFLPSYTASHELNTLGGMIANNSGGEKHLKYGKTDAYVDALEVVLADGEMYELKNVAGKELAQKLAKPGFEGDIYRAMSALLREHTATIAAARPKVSKNSSGYALWDIGDGIHSMNLARLMVGAQGTLGIITRADVSLRPIPKHTALVVIFLASLDELSDVSDVVQTHAPDSFECYDDHTFRLALKLLPELAVHMHLSLFTLMRSFIPEARLILLKGIPKMVLLIEVAADTYDVASTQATAIAHDISARFPNAGVRIAKPGIDTDKYWRIRRESFNLLRKKVKGLRTVPFIDDFVVPPQSLSSFFPKLRTLLDSYDFTYTITGHIGDGNFHIIPLMDPRLQEKASMLDEVSHKVYDLVLSYKGSISGEHNDGLVRAPYLEKMFGTDMVNLFKETKRIFDPLNIFNPGKKLPVSWDTVRNYLDG